MEPHFSAIWKAVLLYTEDQFENCCRHQITGFKRSHRQRLKRPPVFSPINTPSGWESSKRGALTLAACRACGRSIIG
jgi:hypothetical protein